MSEKEKEAYASSLEKLYVPYDGKNGAKDPGVHSAKKKGVIYADEPPPLYSTSMMKADLVKSPNPTNPAVVIQQVQAPPRPSDYLNLSLCTCCFCPLFGLVAIICSILSKSSADDGKYESARQRGRCARNLVIVAVVSGLVIVGVALPILLRRYDLLHKDSEEEPDVELLITEDVCNPYSSKFNIYTCVGLATARIECNKRSRRFNLYGCLGLDSSCEPGNPDYDPIVCDSRVTHDICNPFSDAFDPSSCVNIFLSETQCNPFSDVFDEEACVWLDEHDMCNPFSDGYDVQACMRRLDLETGGSVALTPECDPSSEAYSPSDCDVSPVCDIHSALFDPFACLGKKR